ncbi:MAG: NHL repeat-containing protein [Planctomycetota bacterium]
MSNKFAIYLVAVTVSALGCGRAEAPLVPAGVVAEWGSRGVVDGAFVKPRVIDVLPDGDVIVIDRSERVQRFDPLGVFRSKFDLANTEKGYPTGMTVDSDGNMWIAETHAYSVGVYAPDYLEIMRFGEYGVEDGQFVYVTDVAISSEGKVYVSDFGGGLSRVQEFTLEGSFVRKLGEAGEEPGEFQRPQALCCLANGDLLVADAVNHRIQKFAPSGEFVGAYGAPGTGAGELRYPYDLAPGADGTVYIAEYGNHRIQRMTADGRFTGIWSGGDSFRLIGPWGVAVNGEKLYVLDTGNSRIVQLDLSKVEWSQGGRSG